jgi:serine-type D-Ala-D-Ala carboxypeptidase (penicillin-binding protein 5/6)
VRLCLVALLAALALAAPASAAAPEVDARAWVVQNGTTGEVLLAHDAGARVPIASITKLMTVLVALEHARLDDLVLVDRRAAAVGESTIHLRPGERVSVRDLVEAALVQSANDAANALAIHVGGSVPAFAVLMNRKAAQLGLRDTHFVRPDGLDVAGHVSSARDVTKLARVAMQNPTIRATVRLRRAEAAGRSLFTWNDLLGRFPGLIGVKTGHTSAAGWSEVAAARGRGLTVYATVLGAPTRASRNSDLAELLAWGLAQYRVVPLVQEERVYARASLPYGHAPVALVAAKGAMRDVRVSRPLVERVVAPASVGLPVRKGQRLGEVRVYEGRRLLATRPLVAARSVAAPGTAAKVRWYAGETLRNLGGLFS